MPTIATALAAILRPYSGGMNETNADLVRERFAPMREGDVEALLTLIHPDFEVTTPPGLAAEPDTYRGPEGIRRYFDSFYEIMDRVSFEPHDFIGVGERVVVPVTLRARGRTTGIETTQKLVQVWELRDEKAYRIEVYATLEEAMEAARSAES
jgi:ketosteroid isomerase-like protein